MSERCHSHRAGLRQPIAGAATPLVVSMGGPGAFLGRALPNLEARNDFAVCDDGCVAIALTKGCHTIVDAKDFELLAKFRWWASWSTPACGKVYAKAKHQGGVVWMHKVILGIDSPLMGDHIDGQTLNNRRNNLRVADARGNNANRRCRRSASGYRGVYRVETGIGTRWVASVSFDRRVNYLGTFGDPVEAARAYDEACLRLHGEFGILNFPKAAQC